MRHDQRAENGRTRQATGLGRDCKLADLLVLDADPIADIQNIRTIHRVIKAGKVYEPAALLVKGPGR
jgi:hypothetical protein